MQPTGFHFIVIPVLVQCTHKGDEKKFNAYLISFNRAEDAAKALEQARAKVFFGRKVTAEAHDGVDDSEADYRPPEAELDEYHHKATRTLFVGNLQLDISKETLKDIFHRYGIILVS